MKERGIIMSAPMVKALLDGSKTQTRRLMKPQPASVHHTSDRDSFPCLTTAVGKGDWAITYSMGEIEYHHCPYGVAGDRLYVKETHWRFGKWVRNGKTKTGRQRWRFAGLNAAEFTEPTPLTHEKRINPKRGSGEGWYKRPSIFMPKWAARIWLELTRVRVERLQDISEEDAKAEGIESREGLWRDYSGPNPVFGRDPIRSYSTLWDSLHGKGAWERNDWVWVLVFPKI